MTKLKIQGTPGQAAQAALEPHIGRIYSKPGVRVMGVVELRHYERTQPAPGSEKEASVSMRVTHLEVPTTEQEDIIREVQRTLYLQRTARGTLDEDGQITLDEHSMRLAAGQLHAVDAATLRAAIQHWAEYGRRVLATTTLTETELRHELDNVLTGLTVTLNGTRPEGDHD